MQKREEVFFSQQKQCVPMIKSHLAKITVSRPVYDKCVLPQKIQDGSQNAEEQILENGTDDLVHTLKAKFGRNHSISH